MEKILKHRKKKFNWGKIENMFLRLDMHGSEISVNLDGDTHFRTYLGSICTLITFVFVILYINLRQQALSSAPAQTTRALTEIINLSSYPY